MPLTEKQEQAYLEAAGTRCPYCGYDDVTGGPVTVDAGGCSQEISCEKCGAGWYDLYTLAGIVERYPPEAD